MGLFFKDLRSTLHPDGADVVQPTLLDVAALRGELQALALEVLLLEHGHLRNTEVFFFVTFSTHFYTKQRRTDQETNLLHSQR